MRSKKYNELNSFLGGIYFYVSRQDKIGSLYYFSGAEDYEGVKAYVTLSELEEFANEILLFCKNEREEK